MKRIYFQTITLPHFPFTILLDIPTHLSTTSPSPECFPSFPQGAGTQFSRSRKSFSLERARYEAFLLGLQRCEEAGKPVSSKLAEHKCMVSPDRIHIGWKIKPTERYLACLPHTLSNLPCSSWVIHSLALAWPFPKSQVRINPLVERSSQQVHVNELIRSRISGFWYLWQSLLTVCHFQVHPMASKCKLLKIFVPGLSLASEVCSVH